MARVYLAAKYDEMMQMREEAEKLRAAGHVVTAQWIDGKEENNSMEAAALMDFKDVALADTLIAFSKPRGTLHSGGGRHVEFGIALALGKRLFVVGPKGEHVFHGWHKVTFYDTLDAAMEVL